MRQKKITNSISHRINCSQIIRLIAIIVVSDLIAIILMCSLWCLKEELETGSRIDQDHNRQFTSVSELISEHPCIKCSNEYKKHERLKTITNTIIFLPGKNIQLRLIEIYYTFENQKGIVRYRYFGFFFIVLYITSFFVGTVQLVFIVNNAFIGVRKTRQSLKSIDELAFKADMLARASSMDQIALNEIEAAIKELDTTEEGLRIHTNNEELGKLEDAINELFERMRETGRQQALFVSDASHELRTPIAVLQGYIDLLDRWGKTDEQILEESIEAIKYETIHMNKLIEQLLFLARGDGGGTHLEKEVFSLNSMITDVCDEARMIDTKHIYILGKSESFINIKGDLSMLKQVARILLDNASKYSPENSEIRIKTKILEDNMCAFVVQDEGYGMSREDTKHMFERFYRSEKARHIECEGTGLGLSIAKWIVERHQGRFEVISYEDIGTRISVCLPQCD